MVRTSTSIVLAVSGFSCSEGRSACHTPLLIWQGLLVFDPWFVWVDLNGDMLIHSPPYILPHINSYDGHAGSLHSRLMVVSSKHIAVKPNYQWSPRRMQLATGAVHC